MGFILKDGKIEAEDFTSRLYRELNSSPQPYLVPFLKVIGSPVRLSLGRGWGWGWGPVLGWHGRHCRGVGTCEAPQDRCSVVSSRVFCKRDPCPCRRSGVTLGVEKGPSPQRAA